MDDPPGTGKRSTETRGCFDPVRKSPKLSPSSTPSHVDKSAKHVTIQDVSDQDVSDQDVSAQEIIYALDMEKQIVAEARGVTRKNIKWGEFHPLYLRDFSVAVQSKPTIDSVKEIGKGTWEEGPFWNRLRTVFSNEVLRDLKLFSARTKTLPDTEKGKETPSKPDFVLHTGNESPDWADVELLFEHTRSKSSQAKVTQKFLQWLRGAWSVFYHQPFRRHLYGIMFIQPHAFVCYADHGCAVYSEPLDFVGNNEYTQFLRDFLLGFIANPEYRGNDPTVKKKDRVYICHAGRKWVESSDGILWYRPSLIGRHIRVALVECENTDIPPPETKAECENTDIPPEAKVVMKSTWEEKLPTKSSPPSEVEVLTSLLKAKVRGLPQPFALDKAIVRDNGGLEVETCSFPKDGEVALQAASDDSLEKIQASFVDGLTSKPMASCSLPRIKIQTSRQQFNKPLNVRRRLTRILMSHCTPLKEAMRNGNPKSLMRIIRDAMIVYYEAYKLPESGFIQGDISIENIVVPTESSKLTGGLTYEDRRGTIIDWNLCFAANGTSSTRVFRSGTPAFMAPVLLENKQITRRTLRHDMESFFAVIIWIATLNYDDEKDFRSKPLAQRLLDTNSTTENITDAKMRWFGTKASFLLIIANNFHLRYRQEGEFLECVVKLREILYQPAEIDINAIINGYDGGRGGGAEDVDPAEEGLFQKCMEEIDKYLGETKGCAEMRLINSQVPLRKAEINF